MKMFLANRSIAEYVAFGIAAILCALLGFRIGVGGGTQSSTKSESLPDRVSVVKAAPPVERAKPTANQAIKLTVDSWMAAWERKDVEAYMSHYTLDARI